MDFDQAFLPLKKYHQAIAVTLSIAMLVAAILCLHLYHIKLERSYNDKVVHFQRLNGQLDQAMSAAETVFQSVFISLEQPLSYHFDPFIMATIDQRADYYYRKLPHGAGEVIGRGRFLNNPQAYRQWQQVMALGPAFNTALALILPVDALAYVKDNGFAFVKRRYHNESHLLTALLEGKLSPDFSEKMYSSTGVVEINGRTYFAIGQRRSSTSNEHVLLVYNTQKVLAWLNQVGLPKTVATLLNKHQQNLLTHHEFLTESQQQRERVAPWLGGIHLYSEKSTRPIDLAFKQTEQDFRTPILYEIALELLFLASFIGATFLAVTWLSNRIFIRPVSHFVRYLTLQEHAPKTTFDYIIPEDWQPWFAKIKRVVTQKQELLEQLKQHNDVLDEQVQTQKKQLARSLDIKERQAALLNTMLDNIPDLIYFKNIDGSFIGCNAAFEAFLKVNKSELVGKELHEVTDKFAELTMLEQCMREQRHSLTETLLLQDTSYMFTVAPFYNEQHRLIGSFGVARDVTEQQQVLKSLQTSEENFKAAMEYAPNGVILASIDGKVLSLNKAAKRYLTEHQPKVGSLLSRLFDEQSYKALTETFAVLLEQNKKAAELTMPQSGPYMWLQLSISLVWDKQRQPKYFVIHLQNITQLTRAKLDAERATLAKSRFIANISHEIRTPINVVLGLVDIVKEQGLNETQSVQMGQVSYAAQQLLDMLNSILAFAKVERHQESVRVREFEIVTLVDDCYKLMAPLCAQKGLQLTIELKHSVPPTFKGDMQKIKQILINLLSNAIKYTQRGKVVLAIIQEQQNSDEQRTKFSVIDTGQGIKEVDQERLFDAFTQVDESLSRKHDGIGLGLAIVKQEVALLGGEIQLNSQYGQGSEFYFSLPLEVVPLLSRKTDVLWFTGNSMRFVCSDLNVCIEQDKMRVLQHLNDQPASYLVCESAVQLDMLGVHCEQGWLDKLVRVYVPESTPIENLKVIRNKIKQFPQVGYAQRISKDIEQQLKQKPQSRCQDVNVTGSLCLIVDDNELNLDITSNLLQQVCVNIVRLNGAQNIVEIVSKLQPDVILMDVQMPELDGYQATELLRKALPEQPVAIIALTANDNVGEVNKALSVGMNDYLIKPVEKGLLSETLALYVTAEIRFFDRAFALEQVMGKEPFLITMLEKFAKLSTEYLHQLDNCESHKEVSLLAHSIKGAAAGLGFCRLAEAAKVLELHIKTSNKTPDEVLVTDLKMRLQQVELFLTIGSLGD
ncbi:ATP-binding protein [Pseudoalteromonas sp. MMG005]|uniref:ATP-binding protein n=1 Tax=Pseudoalteromonas sp. MMG005 TaxID=2822682 RepID=UPI001B3A6833|nr:ATP-binding protein [Pseudoalteromonas sp. MMG005]MBQ4845679.1 response regulator [Pseudoalteromonas sp. MMG005]